MIESVRTVIQSMPLASASGSQGAQASSDAVRDAPQFAKAPYISPYISVSQEYDRTVLQIRDSVTGEVTDVIPSESKLEAQLRQSSRDESAAQKMEASERVEKKSVSSGTDADAKILSDASERGVDADATSRQSAYTAQQESAFQAAARSGNVNAGSFSLFV